MFSGPLGLLLLKLKLQNFREIGQESFLEKWAFPALIGAFSGPTGAFWGWSGPMRTALHSCGETAEIPSERAFFLGQNRIP